MDFLRNIARRFAALLLPLLVCSSCKALHDDLSDCDFYLRFVYDYNMERQDLFSGQVTEVQVFVFDPQGGYIRTLTEKGDALRQPGYRMHIPYDLKGSTFVVWAGKTGDYYTLPDLQAGDPITKLVLSYDRQRELHNAKLDPIWHSGPSLMTFPDEGQTTQTASLVRTTNDLRVALRDKNSEPVDPARFDIILHGANNAYDHTHALFESCMPLTYTSCPEASSPTEAWLYTMRLLQGNTMQFSVIEKTTGRFVTIAGERFADLTPYLLRSKPDGMEDQEYLDRRYEWDITLDIDQTSYLALSITINGWKHWFQGADQ